MTEKKRYFYDNKRVAILKDNEFWLECAISTACNHSEICNELNQLNDENEQLKKAYNDAKSDVEKYEQILKDIMEDNLLIQDAKKGVERMTEKRFKEIISTQKVIDNQTGKEYDCLLDNDLFDLINTIAEENEWLKQELYQQEVSEQRRKEYDEFWKEKMNKRLVK